MSKKSQWTPSAKTIVKKAETRFRKKLNIAKERHVRLTSRHRRLSNEISKALTAIEVIAKEGAVLTPAEKQHKIKEEAKVAHIIAMHDKEHKSFADIGKALKISHAWAHAVYVAHGGKSNWEAAKARFGRKSKVQKFKRKVTSRIRAGILKNIVDSNRLFMAKAAVKKAGKRKETPAIKEGGSWRTTDDL